MQFSGEELAAVMKMAIAMVGAPDFGDTSPKQGFVFQFSSHSRTPLREHSQIRDFSASPKSTLPKHKNALFIEVSEDWYSAKC